MLPEIVRSCSRCLEVTQRILLATEPSIRVSAIFKCSSVTGKISIVAFGMPNGRCFLFDIYNNPDLVIAGGIQRILQSVEILKVVHDCKTVCQLLEEQFGVQLKNIFDTQVAFTLDMELRGLPPRLIALHDLYEKCTGFTITDLIASQKEIKTDGNFWCRRPVSHVMLRAIQCEASMLAGLLYEHAIMTVPDDYKPEFRKRCLLATRGIRHTVASTPGGYSPRWDRPVSTDKLTRDQRLWLECTEPLGSEQRAASSVY